MVRFARGLKSIWSALLNLSELGQRTRQIGSILGYILNHQLHASYCQLMMPTTNVTSTHPMSCNPKFSVVEILQCLVDKYQITYQNVWCEGVIRSYLVESSYCKGLRPLKGAPVSHHFLHKKNVFSRCCYIKETFKNNEAYQNF